MFGIGIYEILVIVLVICLVTKPEDVPHYFRHIKKAYRYVLDLKSSVYEAVAHDDYIKGDDKLLYKSYRQDSNEKIKDVSK